MGRQRTLDRRKEREQQKKKQRNLYIVIGAVVVAVLAVVIVLLITVPADAPIPNGTATRYQGIDQSNDKGFPVLGNVNAPVKVVEYSSFDCSHCAEFHDGTWPQVLDTIRKGEVVFTYVPVYGTGGIQNGQGAAKAAICAGDQGKFWEMYDALFAWQTAYANTAFSQNRFVGGVNALGLDKSKWDQCFASGHPDTVVAAAMDAFRLQGAAGTPALLVNGNVVDVASNVSLLSAIQDAFTAAGGIPAVESTAEATTEATQPVAAEVTAEATTQPTVEKTAEATTEATTEATVEATAS